MMQSTAEKLATLFVPQTKAAVARPYAVMYNVLKTNT